MNTFTSKFDSNKKFTEAVGRFVKSRTKDSETVQSFLDHALLKVSPAPIGDGNFTPLRDLLTKTAGIGAIKASAIEAYALAHVPNMKWKTDKNGDRTLCKKDKDEAIVVSAPAVDEHGTRILWTNFKRETEIKGYTNVSDEAIAKRIESVVAKLEVTTGDKAIVNLESQIKLLEAMVDAIHAAHTVLVLEATAGNTDVDTDEPTVIAATA